MPGVSKAWGRAGSRWHASERQPDREFNPDSSAKFCPAAGFRRGRQPEQARGTGWPSMLNAHGERREVFC